MSFVVKQPNGLYCRFSTIFNCPVRFNMTEDEYIESCVERAKREAIDVLENHLKPFDTMLERFEPNNVTVEEFNKILKRWAMKKNIRSNKRYGL